MYHRGRRITSAEKCLIDKVRRFMKMECNSKQRISLAKVTDPMTIFQWQLELAKLSCPKLTQNPRLQAAALEVPKRERDIPYLARFAVNVDDFDRGAIRRTVHKMYEQKEYPTLDNLLAKVRANEIFPGGRTTLYLLL